MTLEKNRNLWSTDLYFDSETRDEVRAMSDAEAKEAFAGELEFGTGGLRAIMGAGTARLNRYTVRRATAGLAAYLVGEGIAHPSVVIAYDSRNHSAEFAKEAALVLCAAGVTVRLFSVIAPTPVLSFSVRYYGADAGIVLTASHNPKEYNGYKVYGADGCQATPRVADIVSAAMDGIADITTVLPMAEADARAAGLLLDIGEETLTAFCDAVLTQSAGLDRSVTGNLHVVYTPLHGAGFVPVTRVLGTIGVKVTPVPEQTAPDGNFPTVISPNPENHEALALGIELAEKTGADLVLGTDPDSDRVGVGVRTKDGFALLSGNQIGALLSDYLFTSGRGIGAHPVLVKTVVTNELGAEIARAHGAEIREVLTGFKYIGEQIGDMEKDGSGDFVLGYEESYGYLVGTHARDKDAVVASMLISEMAAYHKAKGKTLVDVLEALYRTYGFYLDALDSFTLKGLDGKEKIKSLMKTFRTEGKKLFPAAVAVLDFSAGIGNLPKSDVLKFTLAGGSWIAVRPSGTEPKIKIYYSVREEDRDAAAETLDALRKTVKETIEA